MINGRRMFTFLIPSVSWSSHKPYMLIFYGLKRKKVSHVVIEAIADKS